MSLKTIRKYSNW